MKGKLGTILILLATLILAGVAVFTAIRLYDLRNQAVAPNVPSSIPRAQEIPPSAPPNPPICVLNFSLINEVTPTPTATTHVTATPTATPVPQCNDVCTSVAQCGANQVCNIPTGATSGNCRNAACTSEASCVCATATPTPTATPTTPPTGAPNACNGTCGSNFNCADGLMCYQGFCRNPSCASNSSCLCGGATATPTAPALPQSGTSWPTVAGFGLGIFVIVGSLLLAL